MSHQIITRHSGHQGLGKPECPEKCVISVAALCVTPPYLETVRTTSGCGFNRGKIVSKLGLGRVWSQTVHEQNIILWMVHEVGKCGRRKGCFIKWGSFKISFFEAFFCTLNQALSLFEYLSSPPSGSLSIKLSFKLSPSSSLTQVFSQAHFQTSFLSISFLSSFISRSTPSLGHFILKAETLIINATSCEYDRIRYCI